MPATSPEAIARKLERQKQRRRQKHQQAVPAAPSANRKFYKGPPVHMTKAEMYEMLAAAVANTRML